MENTININEEQLKNILESLNGLKEKKNKFLFVVSESPNPAASIYEIYFHATSVKKLGYDVKMLVDTEKYVVPEWIEKSLTDFEHISMEKNKLNVSPSDVLVIPEIYTNVMEATKNLPCIRVALLQSIDYMLNAIIPSMSLSDFNIKHVITTSLLLQSLIEEYYGVNKFDIKVYDIGIPEYFHRNKDPKQLVISVIGRNPNEVSKVIKLFYTKYPDYNFITFDTMITNSKPPKSLRRVDFAERLRKNFAALWIDRISSFGTFPLECMKSGTIPVGLLPDIIPEYLISEDNKLIDNSGVWTQDIYALPILLGDIITKFLDDSIDENLYTTMEEITLKYSQENSERQIQEIYRMFLAEKEQLFENVIKQFNEKNNENLND